MYSLRKNSALPQRTISSEGSVDETEGFEGSASPTWVKADVDLAKPDKERRDSRRKTLGVSF